MNKLKASGKVRVSDLELRISCRVVKECGEKKLSGKYFLYGALDF